MSDELRVQRREACEHAPLDCDDFELPWRCDGCDGHGSRWVTVGELDEVDAYCPDCLSVAAVRGSDVSGPLYALAEPGSGGLSGNLPTEVQS